MNLLWMIYALGAGIAVLLLSLATIGLLVSRSLKPAYSFYRPWFGSCFLGRKYFPVIVQADSCLKEKRIRFRRARFAHPDEAVHEAQAIMRQLHYLDDDELQADRKEEEAQVADLDLTNLMQNAQRKR